MKKALEDFKIHRVPHERAPMLIMVEVPSVAIKAYIIISEVDFFSNWDERSYAVYTCSRSH
jgi:phosphoenolpyruvate-protein kinase (PTS system EI component)